MDTQDPKSVQVFVSLLDLIAAVYPRSCCSPRRTVVYQQHHREFTHSPVTSRRPGILRHDGVRTRASLCGESVSSALDFWQTDGGKVAEGLPTKQFGKCCKRSVNAREGRRDLGSPPPASPRLLLRLRL